MNKIFKVIWNPATGSYSVASETAKSRGKKSGRSKLLISALVAGGLWSSFGASATGNAPGTPVGSGDKWVAFGENSKVDANTTNTNVENPLTGVTEDAASVALGYYAEALGWRSTAIGSRSEASGENSTAIGVEAKATAKNTTAVGDFAQATGSHSMALGGYSVSSGVESLAVGHVAKATGEYNIAMGTNATTANTNSIAIGRDTEAATQGVGESNTGYALAIGSGTKAYKDYTIALGRNTKSSADYATAMGYMATASGTSSLSLGQNAKATNTNSIAIGLNSNASTINALALGTDSKSSGDSTIAIGFGSKAGGTGSIALGSKSSAGGNNSIALGADSEASEDNTVSVGSSLLQRRIVNMAAGAISSDSKEAINGSQLYAISQSVATRLGGGAGVASNGTLTAISFKLKRSEYSTVGDALQGIDNDTLHWDENNSAFSASYIVKNADGTITSSEKENKIINVEDGTISATSTDAVNGSQLNATNTLINQIAGNTSTTYLQNNGAGINYVRTNDTGLTFKDASASGAGATAVGYNAVASGKSSAALGDSSQATGEDALALGRSALASSADAIAIGAETQAAENATAIGNSAKAKGANSIALGAGSTTQGNNTIALGVNSFALGNQSLSLGTATQAKGVNSTALGNASLALGDSSLALGDASEAESEYSIAMGATAIASGIDAIAIGHNSKASDANTIALGNGSQSSGLNSIALGKASAVSGDNSLALGSNTSAVGINSVALGAGSIADLEDSVSVGNDSLKRKIVNVKNGTIKADSNDAINGSQLYSVSNSVATSFGGGATVSDTGVFTGPKYNIGGNEYTNVGAALTALDNDALLWDATAKSNAGAFSAGHGKDNTPSIITNVADGQINENSSDAVNGSQLYDLKQDALLWNSTAFSAKHGTNGTDSKITNVLAGTVSSTSTDAINGGQLYSLADSFTTYLGGGADISDTGALTGPTYTIGSTKYYNVGDALNAINSSFSTSLGDALLWDATAKKFSAMHDGKASVITNVSDGAISENSSDAVNGSQLYDTSKYIADALGGDAEVNADGTITAPTYTIANADYDNVGEALEAIDTTLDDALLWDATANGGKGAFSAGRGVDNTASKITNVANGAISAASSDAINGSQLYTTNKYIADALGGDAEVNADGTITAPTYTIANAEYNNIGDALDALDDNALLWDATANDGKGAYNASHDGKASIITNVADGNIGEGSTDAVNGSQLNAANLLIEQNSQIINQLAGNTNTDYIEENGAGINYVRTNDTGLTFTDASAAGIGSTAVGYNSVAKGDSSVAIGQGSYSDVDTGIALGSSSVSKREIVKGSRDTSVSEEGVVIGYDTTDGELLGALSIGDDGKYRQIINVADGSEAHDAVTVRQLQNAIGAVATTPTKYFHANSTEEDSLAVGTDSLAMGAKTIVNGDKGIGIGYGAYVEANALNGIAIGSNAQVIHVNSIAIGNGSTTTRGAQTNYTAYNMDAPQNSVGEFSVGSEDGQRQITNVAAGSADTDAVNVGQLKVTDERVAQNTQSITNLNTQVTNLDTRVTNIENGIGDIVTTGSTKYFKTNTDGVDANAQGKDSVAIGSGSIAAADNSVALGTGSVATEENTISVGSSTNQRRITHVATGKNDTDAVNVAQLKSSEAGGVRYDTKADGSVDYSNITLGGSSGGTTRISNVSAGVNNNDAVNYAQLKQSVQENKQYTDQRMAQMDHKLSKTESKLSGGIASAMAMTGLPQAYEPGANMASIGGGTYNGESAVALGVSMVSDNGRWVYKLQGSTNSQGDYSAAIGAGIQW
ncbi:YadA-like family protein [Escherichia fergusonii]|uniref:YadA-like family protein n=1 Tax=Escherichia fergusonii TaxID=564 RepID=UPI0015EADA06|nr:YadA-like family protein [Escherichia fergusonii]QME65259.1 YadA-like family protein [Escherichia fergusonii]QME69868.1 YadA-like family protein [Escherichia fergusonii]